MFLVTFGAARSLTVIAGVPELIRVMDIPILAKAGALTGNRKYFDMAARHFAYMQKIVRRPDGLYRHQASTEAA